MLRSSAVARLRALPARWRSRGATGVEAFAAALANAPENAVYGLLAFAPLGAAYGPMEMALALLATVISNAIATTLGAGRLVSGQRASLSLLTAGLVGALTATLTPQGVLGAHQVMWLVALGVVAAGLLQTAFGLLKLGNIVKYTPHPVRVGVTSGVGLLLVVTAVPVILGHPFGAGLRAAADTPRWGALAVGACAFAVTGLATRWLARVPPALVGLFSAAVLHEVLAEVLDPGQVGALIGTLALPTSWFAAFDPRVLPTLEPTTPLCILVGSYALTVAVLASLDSLLAISVVDGRLRRRRDANRELCAQGLANIASGFFAGQPLSPSMPRSLALVVPHPDRRQVVGMYAVALLVLLLLAPGLIGRVPSSAVGGVLLLQGLQMIGPSFWRAPIEFWRMSRRGDNTEVPAELRSPSRAGDWAIELAVALSAVLLGVGPAVLIGATCAVLLFVRSNMRDVVRRLWSGAARRSLKARPPALDEVLAREGERTALLELDGSLFFGTADGLRARLERLEGTVDTVILDLHQIKEIDVTAARILFEVADHWGLNGKHLVFSEWAADDPRRRLIERAGTLSFGRRLNFSDTTDLALEEAEDRLLARSAPAGVHGQMLTLADTLLGRGLDAAELAHLGTQMRRLCFPRDQLLFRQGDPGDGFYVSLQGDIGLRIPGSTRRLASFAPGVVIGEMATLAHGTRSAEAVAESDVTALLLTVDAFDRLMDERPALAAKLLRNMSLHLASRVRTLTGDLSRWVSRAGAERSG